MSILNVYKRRLPLIRLTKDKYWDLILSEDKTPTCSKCRVVDGGVLTDDCLAVYMNFTLPDCVEEGEAVSLPEYYWVDAINGSADSAVTLEDIGLTGIDNGLISYDVYDIDNIGFYRILTESIYSSVTDDFRLHLRPVSSNTKLMCYPVDEPTNENGYYAFRGGFLQGFYKLHGFDYQILPQYIEDAWAIEFKIRPRDYEEECETLNTLYPENKGIFFYMGTRAENKFAQFYYSDVADYSAVTLNDYSCLNKDANSYYKEIHLKDEDDNDKPIINEDLVYLQLLSFLYVPTYAEENDCRCLTSGVTPCSPPSSELEDPCSEMFGDDYLEKSEDINIKEVGDVETSEGTIANRNSFKIPTDNKYLFFNRTKDGFNTHTYEESTIIELTGVTNDIATNLYLLMNRTPTGYTTRTIEKFYEGVKNGTIQNPSEISGKKKYSHIVSNDDRDNAFALKYNEDGSISYRYLTIDCDSEKGYGIVEETSSPGLIKKEEWTVIHVKFEVLNGSLNECKVPVGQRKMKIYIYINGYLKFVSKELNEFNFRELRERPEKQEAVPFNISLGGGTQGLSEGIWLDYRNRFPYILPLEKNFGGSFIGDIQSFKFYTCPLQTGQIKNNWLWEMH